MSVKGSTSKDTPVEAITELLETADTSVWTNEDPDVYKWWEQSEKERGPGDGQNQELNVWQPTSATISRISADNTLLEELPPVEIHCITLDEDKTRRLARDTIDYMSEFMSDIEANTEYADIVPTSVQDFREAKLRQKTDHYVYVVEVEITKLTETGV